MTATYFEVCKDLELRMIEEIGSGQSSYNGYLKYWFRHEDFEAGKFWVEDSNNPSNVYLKYFPTGANGPYFAFLLDYELQLSATTGIKQYTGAFWDFFSAAPGYWYNQLASKPDSAKTWFITDGTQIIYFDVFAPENTTDFDDPYYRITYRGYGDDDDGSWIKEDWSSGWPYEINFKSNTTGPVVVSPFPAVAMTVRELTRYYNVALSYEAPGGTGDFSIGYAYKPLYQFAKVTDQYCVDFDGATERLQTDPLGASQALGVADVWTVAAWVKPEDEAGTKQYVYCLANGAQTNRVHLFRDTTYSNDPWAIDIMDGSANQKVYRFEPSGGGHVVNDQWYFLTVRHAGTNQLEVFVDGVEVTPIDKDPDETMVAMTDSSRHMGLGGLPVLSSSEGFNGRIHSAMVWDAALTDDEILYLFENPALFLLRDAGDYVSSGDLQHWHRAGKNLSPDIGKDYGLDPFDLDDENDITDADIEVDFPGG